MVLTIILAILSFALPGLSTFDATAAEKRQIPAHLSSPLNNAPLDVDLAYYKLNGTNGKSNKLTHSFVRVSCGATLSVHHTDPDVFSDAGTAERPILLLNHGYPESSYIWRKTTEALSNRVPLVVPDRPGYGLSEACPSGTDQRTMAGAILETVSQIYGDGKTVILAGHDRGARAMQRAAVDISHGGFPFVKAAGLFVADIVPIIDEYESFMNPRAAVGYFHWAFLPKVGGDFSTNVIMAYGGGNFVDYLNDAGKGVNEEAIELFKADKAWETYHTFYDQLAVTNASVWDYYNGATKDYDDMVADQKAGRKIKMPTHVEYSHYNLVTMSGFDVQKIWKKYVEKSAHLTMEGVMDGQGHFIVELAPEQTIDQLNRFMDRLKVKSVPVHDEL